jgi:hypothetical protein
MLRHVVWYKLTNASEVLTASIIRAMSDGGPDDEGTFETSVSFC